VDTLIFDVIGEEMFTDAGEHIPVPPRNLKLEAVTLGEREGNRNIADVSPRLGT